MLNVERKNMKPMLDSLNKTHEIVIFHLRNLNNDFRAVMSIFSNKFRQKQKLELVELAEIESIITGTRVWNLKSEENYRTLVQRIDY